MWAGLCSLMPGRLFSLTDQPGTHGGKFQTRGHPTLPFAGCTGMFSSILMTGHTTDGYLLPTGVIAV